LVACEQLPETMALNPFTAGSDAASPEAVMAKLRGRPIASPEPAQTSGRSRTASPRRCRSSLSIASAIAIATPSLRKASKRARIAAAEAPVAR